MTVFRIALIVGAALVLSGCASKFRSYDGPEVTKIVVMKADRRMYLLHGETAIKSVDIELGFTPEGHKTVYGDGRTPEGHYIIDRRNPDSQFHLSLGISYPNPVDVARARAMGRDPGGDIFIHGTPDRFVAREDWTWGCIAVDNDTMERIYAMVPDGTPISIYR